MPVFADDDDAGLKKCPIEDDCVEIKNNPASSSGDSPQSAGNSSDLDKNVPIFADAGIQCKRSNETSEDIIGLKKYPIKDGCVEIKNTPASPSIGNSSDLDINVPVKNTELDVRFSCSNKDKFSTIKTGNLSAEAEVFEFSNT